MTLVTLEGIDGSGKTTLALGLRDALAARRTTLELVREPGGVPLAEAVRELLRDPAREVGARAEALLFAAARAQLVDELLRPRLSAGAFVLLDRFADSSEVYQGIGRGIGVDAVRGINAFATGGLTPDRTLLLDVDPGIAADRAHARGAAADRIESAGEAFFARIATGYRQLAATAPERFVVIDANRPPDRVLGDAVAALSDLIDRNSQEPDAV